MGKGEFYNEINQMVKDLIEQDKKRIEIAFQKIKKKVENKIIDIIHKDAMHNYYDGYDPIMYVRTGQLWNSLSPLIIDESDYNNFQFSFGIKRTPPKGPSAMKHDEIKVRVTNKKGEIKIYTYKDKDYDPNDPKVEKIIFSNFMEGIHPNARGETKTTHVDKAINKALDQLLTDGTIDKIIIDVFSK